MEGGDPDQPRAPDPQDVRGRCVADGSLPEYLEGLTEEEMESLLGYTDGSTSEAAAARLTHMMIWRSHTLSEEIAAHHDAAPPRCPE